MAALLFLASGCKEKKGTFTFNVKGRFGNENLLYNEVYTLTNGQKVKFTNIKFFLSNIRLVREDDMEFELKDVMLINLAEPSSMTFNAGEMNQSFKGIRFDVGLDSTTNQTDPSGQPSSSPLSDQDMYWTWIKYVFYKFEGYADLDGSNNFLTLLLYHIGANSNHHSQQINFVSLPSDPEGNIELSLVFDMKKVLEAAGNTVNLQTETVTHTDDNPALAAKISLNFANSFTVE